MSDLQGKFTGLESQLTTQHGEIIANLEAIAIALGAPPPGPTTTLADVVTAITQSNVILQGIRTDLNGYLMEITTTLDTINNNASINAQRLLSTLLQTSCPCDTDIPLLPPGFDTTPTEAESSAQCQRIQYFLDLFQSWTITIAQYIGNQGSISSFQVDNLLQITLGNVDITTGELSAGMPTSVRDSIVAQLAGAVGQLGAAAVDGGLFDAINSSATMDALRSALFEETNAAAGKTAADAAIAGLGLPSWVSGVLQTMLYSAWLNDIYAAVPVVDASAYDGGACSEDFLPSGCWSPTVEQIAEVPVTNLITSAGTTYHNTVIWPAGWPAGDNYQGMAGSGPLDIHATGNEPFVLYADLFGYWVNPGGGTLYNHNESVLATGGSFSEIGTHTTQVFVLNSSTGFQLCRENPIG